MYIFLLMLLDEGAIYFDSVVIKHSVSVKISSNVTMFNILHQILTMLVIFDHALHFNVMTSVTG